MSEARFDLDNENYLPTLECVIKSLNWANTQGASEKEVKKYAITFQNELTYRYKRKMETIDFMIGDIVDCNFGEHLYEEISGGHVAAIILDVLSYEGLAFVVPLVKNKEKKKNTLIPDTVFYNGYDAGMALLYKAGYISVKRLNCVIGHVRDDSLKRIQKKMGFELKLSRREKEFVYVIKEALNDRKCDKDQSVQFMKAVGIVDVSGFFCRALDVARNLYESQGIRAITLNNVTERIHQKGYTKKEIEKILKKEYDDWVYIETYSLTDFFKIYAKTLYHRM